MTTIGVFLNNFNEKVKPVILLINFNEKEVENINSVLENHQIETFTNKHTKEKRRNKY